MLRLIPGAAVDEEELPDLTPSAAETHGARSGRGTDGARRRGRLEALRAGFASITRSRNCCVRGSRGVARTARSGGPASRITPASRKQTRSAMSRAKPISWVAMTIVMPPLASSRMRLRTSPTSSGSRALVTSSRRSSSGCIASARTIATRCCWPPDSRSGNSSRLSARPNRSSRLGRLGLGLGARRLEDLARRQRHVVEDRHVREQVERLEDDPDPPADAVDVDASGGDLLALDDDPSGVDRLEEVDAAQQRRLAAPRRADQADDLVLGDLEVDAAQDLEVPERLVQALDRGAPAVGAAAVIAGRPPRRAAGRGRPASR